MQEKNQNKEFKKTLSALIGLIPEPALIVDSTGKIVNANKRAEEILAKNRPLLIGNNFEDFLPSKVNTNLSENIKKRLSGENFSPS